MKQSAWIPILGLLLTSHVFSASADEGRARLEAMSRSIVEQNPFAQEETATPKPAGGLFRGNVGGRVKHGVWSLLIPGWSQYRAGQTNRAIAFAGVELGVWTSYGVFQLQGHRREDSYRDWAQQFAGVETSDHGDEYWRAVALFDSNEDYNESVRRDVRVGVTPDGPLYQGGDAWLWQNASRREDYRILRSQSQDAYDRASLTLLFAVLNRVVSFVDAMRTAPLGSDTAFTHPIPEGMRLGVEVGPRDDGPSTFLTVESTF